MSEPVAKERPIVDLDDFERRLRHRDHHNEDPLAELARLVGETNDPYGDVFSREPAPEADFPSHGYRAPDVRQPDYKQDYKSHDFEMPSHGGRDLARSGGYGAEVPPFPSRALAAPGANADDTGSGPRLGGDFAAIEAGLRGALADPSFASDARSYDGRHDGYDHAYGADDAHHNESYAPLPPPAARDWNSDAPAAAEGGSRRPLYFLVATIAVGVLGVGIAFALKGVGSRPGEIRTIQAAAGPTKVLPPTDTSSDQGSHDAGVLAKPGASATTPTRLVNGQEQPVDIGATMQANAAQGAGDASGVPVPPAPGQSGSQTQANGTGPDSTSFGITGMPAPKKVRVVPVRPDGTILPQDTQAANDPIAALSAVQPLSLPGGTPDAVTPGDTKANASRPDAAKTDGTKSGATPKTTSRVSTTPKVATATPDDDVVKPAKKPKVKRVAAVEPAATDTAATETPKATGDFSVQLAAPASESEAKAVAARFSKKFADALDGRRLGVHKAQSNGKAVYRVRASAGTRDEAVSLCDKLKAAGGSCFVARN